MLYAPTKADAETRLRELIRWRDEGRWEADVTQTVGQFLTSWLAGTTVRYNTRLQYERSVKHLKFHLGTLTLAELGPGHIERAYRTMRRTLGPSTVEKSAVVLRMALGRAVEYRLLTWNPASPVKLPKREHLEMATLTEEELVRFLDSTAGSRWHALYCLLAMTGMRIGEALALTWDDLDWTGKVSVSKQLQYRRGEGFFIVPPKTEKGRRAVTFRGRALDALRKQQARQNEDRLKAGPGWLHKNLIFAREKDGGGVYRETVQWNLRRDLLAIGIIGIRVHDLRHTYATLMLNRGHPVHAVSKVLGHSNVTVTLNTYAHLVKGQDEDMAGAMAELVESSAAQAG